MALGQSPYDIPWISHTRHMANIFAGDLGTSLQSSSFDLKIVAQGEADKKTRVIETKVCNSTSN
jgi:hypothetical protein